MVHKHTHTLPQIQHLFVPALSDSMRRTQEVAHRIRETVVAPGRDGNPPREDLRDKHVGEGGLRSALCAGRRPFPTASARCSRRRAQSSSTSSWRPKKAARRKQVEATKIAKTAAEAEAEAQSNWAQSCLRLNVNKIVTQSQ